MMRQAPRLLRVLQQTGAAAEAAPSASAAAPALTRQFGAPTGASPTTPLSPIMPTVVSLPRKVITAALDTTAKIVVGAATSSSVKGLISNVADKLIVEEAVTKVENLDVPFWASVLGSAGYTNQAGFKKLAEAVKPKVATLSADEVVGLAEAFHKANYYDKDLFTGLGANISSNFAKYETEGLLKVVAAFHAFGHYGTELLDDIADSITYCNHYLAPTKVPATHLATAFAAYAKAGHERGDLFTTLARGFSEVSLQKLSPEERRATVASTLKAFYDFQFFPEQTEALLYVAKADAGLFSAEELAVIEKAKAAAEDAVGGELHTYTPGHEDAVHWYGHHAANPTSYSLYVFRDSLVPTSYSPAALRAAK